MAYKNDRWKVRLLKSVGFIDLCIYFWVTISTLPEDRHETSQKLREGKKNTKKKKQQEK